MPCFLTFGILLEGNMTQAATTLRDGQTLAVRLPNGNATTGWPRVALITARIVRRADANAKNAPQPKPINLRKRAALTGVI